MFSPQFHPRWLWLAALLWLPAAGGHTPLRIGFEHSPPVQLLNKDGRAQGPVIEVLTEAARRRGIHLEWVHCPEGPDRALRTGKVDLWPLIADIPERRESLSITSPYLRARWWLVSREESGIRSIADTRGRQVLRQPGLLAEMLVKRHLPQMRTEISPSLTESLERVCRGEAESALVAQGTGDHILLRDRGCDVGSLHVVALPDLQLDFGIGAKRGNRPAEKAASALKDSLVELFDDGQMAAIWLRWGLVVTETRMLADYLSSQRFNRLLMALSLLLLVALAVAVWQTIRWRRAQTAAQAAAEAKQCFLANMSHEIRTPMNAVLGLASLLEQSGLDGERLEYARTIRQSSAVLLRLLNDILDAAKLEAGQFRLIEAPFDLREVVEQVSQLAAPQAREKGIEWRWEWQEGLGAGWIGDGARIRQVILNLTGNALKFTTHGSVILSVEGAGRGVLLKVRDTGPGIDEALRKRLFEKFVQGEASLACGQQGTGLGLAISRALVEKMRGTIELESEPGKGSTFVVQLPLLPAMKVAAAGRTQQKQPEDGLPRHVLVVEDNNVNQFVAERMLARLGCEVEIARDGHQALTCLAKRDYDLVFMDCGLPGMDGYETTRTIRKRENGGRRTPVVAMTAAALEGDREKCLAAGMDDYLTKPIELEALARAVNRWAQSASTAITSSDAC